MKSIFAAVFMLAVSLTAQVVVSTMPNTKQVFLDSNGVPLAGGKVYTFLTGTSTPAATYTDSTGATPNANPVILDSAGRANIWLSAQTYRITVQDVNSVQQWSTDGISDLTLLNTSWIQGGNTFGASGTIGTNDNNAVIFEANNTEGFRLQPNGTSPRLLGGMTSTDLTSGKGSVLSAAEICTITGTTNAALGCLSNAGGFIGLTSNKSGIGTVLDLVIGTPTEVLRFIASAGAARFKTHITAQTGSTYNIGDPAARFANASVNTLNASTVQFYDAGYTVKWYSSLDGGNCLNFNDPGNIPIFKACPLATPQVVLGGGVYPRLSVTYPLGSDSLRWTKLSAVNANFSTIPTYANNAAALAGGLVAGDVYKSGADPDILAIVH